MAPTHDDKTTTVTLNERTKYMLDDQESDKATVLRVGQSVSSEHEDGVATKVEAKTAPMEGALRG